MKKTVLIILICLAIISMPASVVEAQCVADPLVAGKARPTDKQLLDSGRQGTKGRLVIGDFSVALFESDERSGPNAQGIVDAWDSAAWFMWFGSQSPVIGDHCTQGFDVITRCSVGDICYIVVGEDIYEYECVGVDPGGTNLRTDMYLSTDYNFMRGNDPGYLYMYTCNEAGDPYHITVVTWMPH